MPIDATSIFEEGVRIPPVKIYKQGEYNEDLIKLVHAPDAAPDWCRADLNALIASCRVAARRVIEMAERFGDDVYVSATQELLARNSPCDEDAARQAISEEKVSFEDYICDDGMGYRPVQDEVHDVARWRPRDPRFRRHRSAVQTPRSTSTSTKTCSRCSSAST
jgi:N-methylhydantoinase B